MSREQNRRRRHPPGPGTSCAERWSAAAYTKAPRRLLLALPIDGLGRVDLNFAWPAVPPGTALYFQARALDLSALSVAMSNALHGLTN